MTLGVENLCLLDDIGTTEPDTASTSDSIVVTPSLPSMSQKILPETNHGDVSGQPHAIIHSF